MGTVYWKLVREPYVNSAYTGSTSEITSFYDVKLNVKIGSGKDTFDFKVSNLQGAFHNYFQPEDKITIYRKLNSTSFVSDDILMVGAIKDVPEYLSYNNESVEIKGYNFSETIANALVFVDPLTPAWDVAETIEGALNSVNIYNNNFQVTWASGNPSTKEGGGAFPTVNERFFNKPMFDILEKYSTNAYTEDGTYYWYVNNNNELIWRKRLKVSDYTFDFTTDAFESFTLGKDTNNVKNFIIMKGDSDPKGKAIQTYAPDYTSIAEHGYKYYFFVSKKTYAKNAVEIDMGSVGVSGYDELETYINSGSITPWWSGGSSYTSWTDYINALRVYVKAELKKEGQSLLRQLSKGKLQVKLVFKAGTTIWGLGDLISVNNLPSFEGLTKALRVEDIQYTTSTDTYVLVEDEGSI